LCKRCVQLRENGGDCSWPDQLDRIDSGTRLLVLTEQYLVLNPLLIQQVRERVKPDRSLVIFDEALFLGLPIVRHFSRSELEHFREALTKAFEIAHRGKAGIETWIDGIGFLLDRDVGLENLRHFWGGQLNFNVLAAQEAGQLMFGSKFRYLASELELLNSRVTIGQWRDDDNFEIAVRVDTQGSDVLVLAPYVDAEVVEERLARPVVQLFSGIVFRHSASRILNIADPIGTAATLSSPDHFDRVVDFFLALVLRNVARRWRTVLVTRKKFVSRVITRIEQISAALGRPVQCILASAGKSLDHCLPEDIAVINYGIVGVNNLQHFNALYCIGGYYARSDHLNDVYQQSLPPESRVPIGVRMEGRRRKVFAADQRFSTRYHARRAEATHHMIERHVVVQAVGRIRPFTTPAEVILFQCDELSTDLGSIVEYPSLGFARRSLRVPTLAQLKQAARGEMVRARRNGGESLRAIAADCGISPSTASLAAREENLDGLLAHIRL